LEKVPFLFLGKAGGMGYIKAESDPGADLVDVLAPRAAAPGMGEFQFFRGNAQPIGYVDQSFLRFHNPNPKNLEKIFATDTHRQPGGDLPPGSRQALRALKTWANEQYQLNEHVFSRQSRLAGSAFVRVCLWQKKFNSHSFCVEPSLADGYFNKYSPKKS
jgi:hypothetical protein